MAARIATGAFAALFGEIVAGYFESQQAQSTQGGRPLTANEIAEAKKQYGNQINYSRPRIYDEKYFFFQDPDVAMAPDGNIYYPAAKSCTDLTSCRIPFQGQPEQYYKTLGTFIHEMGHVMQYQQGVHVLGWGFLLQAGRILSFGLYNPYNYSPGANPNQLNIEAQAKFYRDSYCRRTTLGC